MASGLLARLRSNFPIAGTRDGNDEERSRSQSVFKVVKQSIVRADF